jgi:DNA repair exonuclease SbcCD nuclease subunit
VKADLILTADWHLREDTPSCRTDNFWESQWTKVTQVAALAEELNCPVIHAGDLFHYWKPSPFLISYAISYLPKNFYTVAGQHDLPQHNLDLFSKCGLNTLVQSKSVIHLREGNFGQKIGNALLFPHRKIDRKVGVWHHFVWDGKNIPWPSCDEMTAKQVLKDNPDFDLIVTGDYHKPFTYEYKGRLLVNCGCLTRQVADYADHKPCVWLWDAETNTVSQFHLLHEKGVVSREHIGAKEEREKRMDAFIQRLSDEWEVSISFEENLKRFISVNRIRKEVIDLVHKAMEL